MASSSKSFLGDRAVKDAQGVGASGGPAVSHLLDAPAAAHGRLLSELKKLLVVAPKTPSPEETIGLNMLDNSRPSGPRSYYDGHRTSTRLRPPGESAKRFPPLTKPVPSGSCRQRADVQVLVTSHGPCSVHGVTAKGRQAETVTTYNKATSGVRQSGLVCRLLNQDAVDEATNEQVLEEDYDDSLYPRISSRRCIVIDEIDAINEHIQLQWAAVYWKAQASLNSRLRQKLADYRGCPGDDAAVPHEGLPTTTTEALRKLVTDLRADLQAACADFDKWRTEYMQNVFQNSCAGLNRRQRLWVLGQILREEIFVSVAVFERRIRTRVAALWKKLVVRRELDLHA
ncbi:hypothetical protein HPB50_025589 [Hyalomma asiaticum]|uniref:Uncharacterized protein n=1 Tax=Hyalomma asiaticum TaxID=266040 RepID=A0ACB7TNZ8_HYAAI|nr:hypothetical protein HPB50_025589 [Hyalomma asiaticum]